MTAPFHDRVNVSMTHGMWRFLRTKSKPEQRKKLVATILHPDVIDREVKQRLGSRTWTKETFLGLAAEIPPRHFGIYAIFRIGPGVANKSGVDGYVGFTSRRPRKNTDGTHSSMADCELIVRIREHQRFIGLGEAEMKRRKQERFGDSDILTVHFLCAKPNTTFQCHTIAKFPAILDDSYALPQLQCLLSPMETVSMIYTESLNWIGTAAWKMAYVSRPDDMPDSLFAGMNYALPLRQGVNGLTPENPWTPREAASLRNWFLDHFQESKFLIINDSLFALATKAHLERGHATRTEYAIRSQWRKIRESFRQQHPDWSGADDWTPEETAAFRHQVERKLMADRDQGSHYDLLKLPYAFFHGQLEDAFPSRTLDGICKFWRTYQRTWIAIDANG